MGREHDHVRARDRKVDRQEPLEGPPADLSQRRGGIEAQRLDQRECILAKVLQHAALDIRRHIAARVIQVRRAHDGHVQAGQAVSILLELAEIGVAHNDARREHVARDDRAERMRHAAVRLDKRGIRRLEEQGRTGHTAALQVEHGTNAGARDILLRHVQMRCVLQRLFAIVEKEHEAVFHARRTTDRERAQCLEHDGHAGRVVHRAG